MQGNARLHRTRTLAYKFPDLNPLDYKVWGLMQDCVYQTAIHDVDELKQRLIAI